MGEYARIYTLEWWGVDIGDKDEYRAETPGKPAREKRFGCSCGRAFVDQQALGQHQLATGHAPSKRARQQKE